MTDQTPEEVVQNLKDVGATGVARSMEKAIRIADEATATGQSFLALLLRENAKREEDGQ